VRDSTRNWEEEEAGRRGGRERQEETESQNMEEGRERRRGVIPRRGREVMCATDRFREEERKEGRRVGHTHTNTHTHTQTHTHTHMHMHIHTYTQAAVLSRVQAPVLICLLWAQNNKKCVYKYLQSNCV
jgi:hypothetical protein